MFEFFCVFGFEGKMLVDVMGIIVFNYGDLMRGNVLEVLSVFECIRLNKD